MSMLLALVALSLAPAAGLPSAEQTKERIIACGVSPNKIRMEVDYGGEDVARLLRGALTAPHVVRCLAQASLDLSTIFEFLDPAERRSFNDVYGVLEATKNDRDARTWLSERGLLARLPHYVPAHESAGHFALSLERFCSIRPGTYLKALGRDTVTFTPEDPRRPPITEDQFSCVMTAATVSRLHLGFVGNEAYQKPSQRHQQK